MASALKNLSTPTGDVPSAKGMKFGIVTAEWNTEITSALQQGAYDTLLKYGAAEKDILLRSVPGTFELTAGAKMMAEYSEVDAVICIGCVIQGDTPHFDYICQGVTHGITELNLDYDVPFIFGVLTTNTLEQCQDRAGGKHGNKGDEAAITAIKMVALNASFDEE